MGSDVGLEVGLQQYTLVGDRLQLTVKCGYFTILCITSYFCFNCTFQFPQMSSEK